MTRSNAKRATMLLACLSTLVSQVADAAEPTTKAQPASTPAATAAKDPAKPAPSYTYSAADKRDPFKEGIEVTLPPPPPNCGRLCEFDLEQLKVSALATGISTPIAGVEAPNGKVYIV